MAEPKVEDKEGKIEVRINPLILLSGIEVIQSKLNFNIPLPQPIKLLFDFHSSSMPCNASKKYTQHPS
jgi:hypothetical protein